MSQALNTESPPKAKRLYRKGNRLSGAEKKRLSLLRKKDTHKEVTLYMRNAYKDGLLKLCKEKGMTQAALVEYLIEKELSLEADPEHSVKGLPYCLLED
ncbi:replication regulatory protein RepA [Erwinia sp. S43]|uniref:replication regulatory protein RepA n=1 Tax=Erwinia sp. S43 TaxID=2769339 RepID=UPI001909E5BF|nr:replication regulatory protein RepA [Erwinia sp. S43]MBK0035863.1 replication regulatory protein RepA [Erwinia sp. S43]